MLNRNHKELFLVATNHRKKSIDTNAALRIFANLKLDDTVANKGRWISKHQSIFYAYVFGHIRDLKYNI